MAQLLATMGALAALLVLSCSIATRASESHPSRLNSKGTYFSLTCYVSPNPKEQPCPGLPCNTLSNYVRNASLHACFSSGATMVFLSGIHRLLQPIVVEGVADLTFAGNSSFTNSLPGLPPEPSSQIICFDHKHTNAFSFTSNASTGAFVFTSATNLTLRHLTLIGCGGFRNKGCGPHAALSFLNVFNLTVDDLTVRNTTGYGLCGSNILGDSTISNSIFAYNNGQYHHPSIYGGNMKLYFRDCPESHTSHFQVVSCEFLAGRDERRDTFANGLSMVLIECSSVIIEIDNSVFSQNKANNGGNMAVSFHNTTSNFSHPMVVIRNCYLVNGTAFRGGGLHVSITEFVPQSNYHPNENKPLLHILNTTFFRNYAWGIAGGLYITHTESASPFFMPMQILVENSVFGYNIKGYHSYPGGIAAHMSTFDAPGYTLHILPRLQYMFQNCNFTDSHDAADDGFSASVFLVHESSVAFSDCNFIYNKCTALAAVSSSILFQGNVTFHNNHAMDGAGLLLCERSVVYLFPNTTALFHDNTASGKGGAIHAEDECMQSVPPCFFQLSDSVVADLQEHKHILQTIKIQLTNNTAGIAGSAVYGGSIDYCYFIEIQIPSPYAKPRFVFDHILNITHSSSDASVVTSDPIGVCLCNDTGWCNSTQKTIYRDVFPGKTFSVSAVIIGQRDGTVPGDVVAYVQYHPDSLGPADYVQNIPNTTCTALYFTVFSNRPKETVVLKPDRPSYTKRKFEPRWIVLNFIPCPVGFARNNSTRKCDCIEILNRNGITCDINKQAIHRVPPTWIGYVRSLSVSASKPEILFHSHCPLDYCKSNGIDLSTTNESIDQNAQCAFQRRGILCGECNDGLSLTLGSSQCKHCSNLYILLLVVFALAGILLVLMLTVCNLTVSEGTINGLIFYANIVQLNKSTFFPYTPKSSALKALAGIPSIFIAWLNLDLGIEVCFFEGMDAYSKTWLQFAFPIYIWTIAGVLILFSRRYNSIARLLGKNVVKVLATLFLISYTQLQRAVIVAVSFAVVATSEGSDRIVWLFDGNIRYLHGKHIPLFAFAVLIGLVSFPYALFLFFITCLQKMSSRKLLFCVNKLKPLLDAYTGPHADKCRFWPGLLLLARVLLLIVYASNIFGNPKVNLTMSACVCFVLLMLSWFYRGGIYKRWKLDILEAFFIANLGFLSTTMVYFETHNWERAAIAYTSTGLSLLVFVIILAYHTQKAAKILQCRRMTTFYQHVSHYCPWARDGYEAIVVPDPVENIAVATDRELEGTVTMSLGYPRGMGGIQLPQPAAHRHFDRYREPLLETLETDNES